MLLPVDRLAVQDLMKANELQPGDQTVVAELQLLRVRNPYFIFISTSDACSEPNYYDLFRVFWKDSGERLQAKSERVRETELEYRRQSHFWRKLFRNTQHTPCGNTRK